MITQNGHHDHNGQNGRQTDDFDGADDALGEALYEADQEHARNDGTGISLDMITRLTRDVRSAASTLNIREVRYLVRLYYLMQEQRIRAAAQMRAANESGEPNALVTWMAGNYSILESDIRRAMHAYARSRVEGQWLLSITGIGPVLAAGLLAHVNIERSTNVAKLWSFAGLNPEQQWKAGERRPWNADLKRLCWLAGQSFVKSSGSRHSQYGPIYRARKAYETANNEAGVYAEQAGLALARKRIGSETIAYSYYVKGQLPPAHIQRRVERWTVKVFLAHFFQVCYETRHQRSTQKVWILAFGGHSDEIACPNWNNLTLALASPPSGLIYEQTPRRATT